MPPGGERANATHKSEKHVDFSPTRCFTMPLRESVALMQKATIATTMLTAKSVAIEQPLRPHYHSGSSDADDVPVQIQQPKREQEDAGEEQSPSSSRASSTDSVVPDVSSSSLFASLTSPAKMQHSGVKRQSFWRHVVKQFNFTDENERKLLISLTDGIEWMKMSTLPKAFIRRHREVFYLISTADYQRSGTIQRDVTRTFSIFERSYLPDKDIASQQQSLFRVLNAISEAEDGYCQGMNFIAALFLVEGLDEADAYALFLYLLKKRHLARIYQRSSTFLDDYLEHFNLMFQRELPDLHQHILSQGFVIPMYGIEWFTTLLLESKLMCMTFEDFLREFKPLVHQIDPYQAIFQALSFRPNPLVRGEDTTAYISRAHYLLSAHQNESSGQPTPPKTFDRHRTLPPQLTKAIVCNNFANVEKCWHDLTSVRPCAQHCLALANEILHYAIWYGQPSIACFAIERCGADVNNVDDTDLTPLHFSVIRNQPDLVRLLLCFGADEEILGGRWNGSSVGLTPLETAQNWRFRDTSAARLVLEKEICLFCNTKIDKLAFSKETCAQCSFTFCHRPHAECIRKHQCPRDHVAMPHRSYISSGSEETSSVHEDDAATLKNNKSASNCRNRISSASTSASTVDSSRRISIE
ncbi:Evi5 protein, partial [Globisporangium splendens]